MHVQVKEENDNHRTKRAVRCLSEYDYDDIGNIPCNGICCYYESNIRMAFHRKVVSVDYKKKSSPFGRVFIRNSSGSKLHCVFLFVCGKTAHLECQSLPVFRYSSMYTFMALRMSQSRVTLLADAISSI